MNQQSDIKTVIIEFCHRLYQKGLVAANDGNLSALTDDNDYWFTPSGLCKGDLTERDLVRVNAQGSISEGHRKLTSEYRMHLAIYEVRPDIRAVVHAHPVFSTAFATARIPMNHCILPEIITTIGSVPLADYAAPSTARLAQSVQEKMRHYDVCMMANHGIVASGRTVADAYSNIERVEHYAKILFSAKLLGGEHSLSQQAVRELQNLYEPGGDKVPPLPSCLPQDQNDNLHAFSCKSCDDKESTNNRKTDDFSSLVRDVISYFKNKNEL